MSVELCTECLKFFFSPSLFFSPPPSILLLPRLKDVFKLQKKKKNLSEKLNLWYLLAIRTGAEKQKTIKERVILFCFSDSYSRLGAAFV